MGYYRWPVPKDPILNILWKKFVTKEPILWKFGYRTKNSFGYNVWINARVIIKTSDGHKFVVEAKSNN